MRCAILCGFKKIQGYWIKFPWLRANQTAEYEQTQHIPTQKKERLKQRCKLSTFTVETNSLLYSDTRTTHSHPSLPPHANKTWPPKPVSSFRPCFSYPGLQKSVHKWSWALNPPPLLPLPLTYTSASAGANASSPPCWVFMSAKSTTLNSGITLHRASGSALGNGDSGPRVSFLSHKPESLQRDRGRHCGASTLTRVRSS